MEDFCRSGIGTAYSNLPQTEDQIPLLDEDSHVKERIGDVKRYGLRTLARRLGITTISPCALIILSYMIEQAPVLWL